MKITSITVKRNYHISNDDSYAKGEWSISADLDDTDNPQGCFELLADELDAAFKNRYPNVRTYVNFDEVIQVGATGSSNFIVPSEPENHSYRELDAISKSDQKINKGTIEEQIRSSESLIGLESFKLIAGTNPKYQKVYDEKLAEFKNGTVNQ